MKMIRILQAVHPGVFIDNEIVEPNPQHVAAYKGKATPAAWVIARTIHLNDEFFCCFVKFMVFFYFLKQTW